MRTFVLGGTGFIGRHVVRRLLEHGDRIAVFHRGGTRADLPPDATVILGDRHDLAACTAEIERFRPEVVVDMIPYTEHEARAVMDTFRGVAQRVVALSSGDVYRNYDGLRRIGGAPPDPWPLAEDAPLRENLYPYRAQVSGRNDPSHDPPGDPASDPADDPPSEPPSGPPSDPPSDPMFDYEKILVERIVLGDPDLPGTVLRLPMVYGPGDRQHRLSRYLRRMDDGRAAILLSQEQAGWRWTRGYVENVAAAVAHAAADDRAAGRVFNVGESTASTEAGWVGEIGRVGGWRGEVAAVPPRFLPAGLVPDYDWRYHLATDTSRFREQLGFVEPVAREEALRRTIDWEREHPGDAAGSGPPDYAAEDAALASARKAAP